MVAQQILNEATQRLVGQFAPTRIILFGSQARGTADEKVAVALANKGRGQVNTIELLAEVLGK